MVLEPRSLPDSKRALTLAIPSKIGSSLESLSSPIHTRPSSDDSGLPTPTTTIKTTQSEPTTLPTDTLATASPSSLPILNVKFAPLPELLPRKRRSSVPLGIAARGQIMRRRPMYRGPNAPPMWTDEGSEAYRLQQEELAARDARSSAYATYVAARREEEDEAEHDYEGDQVKEDDPLQHFGRMVKGAGKTLWKRVSNKDVSAAAATATSTPKGQEAGNRPSMTGSPTPIKVSRLPPPGLRPILGTISSNTTSNVDDNPAEEHKEEGGGVWEETGDGFPRDVSQTETISEGRAIYSYLSSKYPPPSPTLLNSKRMSSFMTSPRINKIPSFKTKRADSGS